MSFLPYLKRQNDEQDVTQERREDEVGPPPSPSTGKSKKVRMPYTDTLHLRNKCR